MDNLKNLKLKVSSWERNKKQGMHTDLENLEREINSFFRQNPSGIFSDEDI